MKNHTIGYKKSNHFENKYHKRKGPRRFLLSHRTLTLRTPPPFLASPSSPPSCLCHPNTPDHRSPYCLWLERLPYHTTPPPNATRTPCAPPSAHKPPPFSLHDRDRARQKLSKNKIYFDYVKRGKGRRQQKNLFTSFPRPRVRPSPARVAS
jgi:hypothetical protein